MTFYEQAIGFVATLVCVCGFVWALVLYSRAGRGARVAVVAASWVLTIALYRVAFFALPEDSELGWIVFMGLTFVFAFAFWGVIDLAIHSNARLRGGEAARFAQGAALLILSAALFVATYFVPDALGALLPDAGFGAYFLGLLGAALAAILLFRAGARAVYANRAALPGLLAARRATAEVMPERAAYVPGETVHATVRVRGKKDFEVEDARAELFYTSRYSYLTPDVRGGSLLIDESDRVVVAPNASRRGAPFAKGEAFEAGEVRVELVRRELVLRDDGNHHETVEAQEAVAGRVRFHPRTSQRFPFAVVVPGDLPCPCSETAHTYVGYFLRGTLDRGPRQDHTVEQELNVFGGPGGDQRI